MNYLISEIQYIFFDNAIHYFWMNIKLYIINNVWQNISISLFKVADV